MREAFLHYVWKNQYFNKLDLSTTDGQPLSIKKSGFQNENAGPDFFEAALHIGEILWSGSVEIHIKSSNWDDHFHQNDDAYNDVVLHVVWEYDKEIYRKDGSIIPTLELKSRIDSGLIERHDELINSPSISIPCEKSFSQINDIIKLSMLDKLIVERLSVKSEDVLKILKSTNGDWEETAYRWLLIALGLKVNKEPFSLLGASLPFKILKKYCYKPLEIEALLFGMSGMLEENSEDNHYRALKEAFLFLSTKHNLKPLLSLANWKFLRLRPANFPTVRLAQLAGILTEKQSVFQEFVGFNNLEKLEKWIRSTPNTYWQKHYQFGKKSTTSIKGVGRSTFELILINTVAPLLVAYGKSIDNDDYIDRAISLLEEVKAEKNKIIRVYEELGLKPTNATDSQALIQLHNEYCIKKRCLNCSIGHSIINQH